MRDEEVIAEGQLYRISPEVYKDITQENKFAQVNKKILSMDLKHHEKAFLMYFYLANQWRIGFRKNHGRKKINFFSFLNQSGIEINPGHAVRDIQNVHNELDFLKNQGLLKAWHTENRDWYRNRPITIGNKLRNIKIMYEFLAPIEAVSHYHV